MNSLTKEESYFSGQGLEVKVSSFLNNKKPVIFITNLEDFEILFNINDKDLLEIIFKGIQKTIILGKNGFQEEDQKKYQETVNSLVSFLKIMN